MNYDELLAKIDGQENTIVGITLESEVEIQRLMKFRKALRAVVELHYEKSFGEDSPIKNVCDTCSKIYPCPTIQAIQKELA